MARRRDLDEELNQSARSSPYDELPEDDVYDDAYDEDGYEEQEREVGGLRAIFATIQAKILAGVIVLLLLVLIALLCVKFLGGGKQQNSDLPDTSQAETASPEPSAATGTISFPVSGLSNQGGATQEPESDSLIFAPQVSETATPSPEPTDTPEPEPTDTPLPIILTNTPTPSPEPTATPSPSPTLAPTPSPTPSPSPVPDIATGTTNRKANLRESASASAKVKETIKKGETLTIHDTTLDSAGRVWYLVTVDDINTDGWMRDYVVSVDGDLEAPTPTPKVTSTPKPGTTAVPEQSTEPTATPKEGVIGTGKTNHTANVRKVMNGKVLVQLNKGKSVDILAVELDKNGNIWYQVQPQGSKTVGYVRDYLITLSSGVELEMPQGAPTPAPTSTPTPSPTAKATATPNPLLDREVVGKAKTNREANVRVKPVTGAALVRQLSKGVELQILDKFAEGDLIWYEVITLSGKTHGYVRDYVISITEIDQDMPAKTYENQ